MSTAREAGAPDWLVDWLGAAGDDVDAARIEQLLLVHQQITGGEPVEGQDVRPEFAAAARVLEGTLTLEGTAAAWRAAVAAAQAAKADLDGAIVASSIQGVTEKEIAKRAGFGANRVTVRRALGKPS